MDKPLKRPALYATAEKDEQYHRLWIEDSLQEIAQRCLGVRKWVQFRSALTVLSRFGYFAVNGLLDVPTPGEEFSLAKVSECSMPQRIMMILLNNDLKLPNDIPEPFIAMIRDVHLITFYLFGDFYELSKRATGVRYLDQNDDTNVGSSLKSDFMNKFIGILSMVKLILNYQKEVEREQSNTERLSGHSVSEDPGKLLDSDILCQLCSSPRNDATSTLCGHIFCWSCIHDWLKQRNECPICRAPTEPSRLVYLINFR